MVAWEVGRGSWILGPWKAEPAGFADGANVSVRVREESTASIRVPVTCYVVAEAGNPLSI